jgi:uncharacterized protein YgbK (DUF1537 family)
MYHGIEVKAARIDKASLLADLPPVWSRPLFAGLQKRIAASSERFVVFDDDPTGAQTLHGLPVLTRWDVEAVSEELGRSRAFFLLTNSRALPEAEAVARLQLAGTVLREACRRSGRQVVVCFRGDSTLRGHFPAEMDAFFQAFSGVEAAARPPFLIVPYFGEGGRFTVNDVQYVEHEGDLVPAGETEYARDGFFGYRSSHLPSWVEEKTRGSVSAGSVLTLSLEDLRLGGPRKVAAMLMDAPDGGCVAANAAHDRDLEVLVAGLLDAEAAGKRFLYRTAASFVRVRAGVSRRPLLSAHELRSVATGGGLLIVGSHVPRSSRQLEDVFARTSLQAVELDVEALLRGDGEAERAAAVVGRYVGAGQDAVLYTSRRLATGATPAESLALGKRIARALCLALRELPAEPRFLVVKGGNTASEIATEALGVRRALALGQLQPGVPVWRLGPEARYPGLRYVIYPGNVSGPEGLAEALMQLGAVRK